jgi:hypothetical protein
MQMQGKRLESEREELIAELEAALAPDIAQQVEAILATTRGYSQPSLLSTSSSQNYLGISRSSSSRAMPVAEPSARFIAPSQSVAEFLDLSTASELVRCSPATAGRVCLHVFFPYCAASQVPTGTSSSTVHIAASAQLA